VLIRLVATPRPFDPACQGWFGLLAFAVPIDGASVMIDRKNLAFTSPLSTSELAALRTLLATDRTLMAWLRTSLALISFGFTVYKVLDGIAAEGASAAASPRVAGAIMAGAGTAVMVIGITDYVRALRLVGLEAAIKAHRFSIIMAGCMVVVGLIMTIAIATHAV
jgi:putative membrane protein